MKIKETKAFKDKAFKRQLVAVLSKITNQRLMKEFLEDLFTPKEFEEMAKRLQIVKQLKKGISQRKIAKDLRVGIATVTRGSRELEDESGGFAKVLK